MSGNLPDVCSPQNPYAPWNQEGEDDPEYLALLKEQKELQEKAEGMKSVWSVASEVTAGLYDVGDPELIAKWQGILTALTKQYPAIENRLQEINAELLLLEEEDEA